MASLIRKLYHFNTKFDEELHQKKKKKANETL